MKLLIPGTCAHCGHRVERGTYHERMPRHWWWLGWARFCAVFK